MRSRTIRRSLLPLVSAVVLVALVGCGGSTDTKSASPGGPTSAGEAQSSGPTKASGPVDVCKLITSSEAKAAVGKPVRPGKAATVGPATSCTYESTDFADGTADGVSLVITLIPQTGMSKSTWDQGWSANGKAVAGLGESAWDAGGGLQIYDHGATLGVSIVSLKTEATLDQLETVARLALGRIS